MKKTMRFFSLVIAVLMICTLTTAAFAAEGHGAGHNHQIYIENETTGYEYYAYQIFEGNLGSDGVLSNIVWGSDITDPDALIAELKTHTAFAGVTDAKSVADVLSGNSATDNPTAIQFAEIVAEFVSGGVKAEYSTAYKDYIVEGLDDGYYLVVNTDTPDTTNTTVSRFILEVVRDVTVNHKGTFPTVDKKILGSDGEKVNVNTMNIGDVVEYIIPGTIPSNIADYNTYYYCFRDELSEGLTYNNDLLVTMDLDGSSATTEDSYDVTTYFFPQVIENTTLSNGKTGTKIDIAIADLLTLDNGLTGTINAHTKIIVTYSATLNEKAVIDGPNPNTVDLIYSNNPNEDGEPNFDPPVPPPEFPTPEWPTGVTPPAVVESYTTALRLHKTDGQGKSLIGAEFQLTGDNIKTEIITKNVFELAGSGTGTHYLLKDGTYTDQAPSVETAEAYDSLTPDYALVEKIEVVNTALGMDVKAFVGDDGYVTFTGLGSGTYTLTETTTPDGYNTIAPIEFEIEFNTSDKKFHCDNNSSVVYDNLLKLFTITVVNVKGNTLPSTGGIGTTLFYVFGGLMFAGAAVLLITKKRMAV